MCGEMKKNPALRAAAKRGLAIVIFLMLASPALACAGKASTKTITPCPMPKVRNALW